MSSKKKNLSKFKKFIRGFTLVEILIVISILSILATFLFMGTRIYTEKAHDRKIKEQVKQVQNALQLYYTDHGRYPQTGSSSSSSYWVALDSLSVLEGDYMDELPIHPSSPTHTYWYASGNAGATCRAGKYYYISARLKNDDDPDNIQNANTRDCLGNTFMSYGSFSSFEYIVVYP